MSLAHSSSERKVYVRSTSNRDSSPGVSGSDSSLHRDTTDPARLGFPMSDAQSSIVDGNTAMMSDNSVRNNSCNNGDPLL